MFIGSVRWWAAVYKCFVVSLLSLLPRPAFVLAPTSLLFLTRAHPRVVASSPSSHPKMPVRLIAADDWRPSSMTERRLLELEREGFLRPRTSSSRP